MYYDHLQRNKQRIIALSFIVISIFVIWVSVVLIGRIGKIPVTVSVVPKSATVAIDGIQIHNGTNWLPPGVHTIKAAQPGFKTIEKKTTVSADKSKNIIALSLAAESTEAKKWASENAEEYSKNEKNGALAANADGKYFTEKNPIISDLPFTDPYFTIGYTVDKDDSVTITIATPSPRYRFYAVEKIRKLGYDPTDYRIVFKDYKNPLEQQ